MRVSKDSIKFMQVLNRGVYQQLRAIAKKRGVTVQELIRVLIIPDWLDIDFSQEDLKKLRKIVRKANRRR